MDHDIPLLCGNPEHYGDGTPSLKLATNRPLVYIEAAPPGFTVDDVWSWLREAHARWSSVCNWQAARIVSSESVGADDYVHHVTVADLGGSGVLMDQQLPYAGGRVLRMRINTRVKWRATDGPMASGTADPIRSACHEIGHLMGHQHWPAGPPVELMEPFIQQSIIRPQPTEAKVSAAWFGPAGGPPSDYDWSSIKINVSRVGDQQVTVADANGRPAKVTWP